MATNSYIESYSIKGTFKRPQDEIVVSGEFETNSEKKITIFSGTAKKNGEVVCTFNIGNNMPGPFPGQPTSGENAINYNNVVDDTLLEAVAPVIRAELEALRTDVAKL